MTPRTRSMHGYKYARTAECDLVFVNSAYTGARRRAASGRSGRPHPRRAIRASPRSTPPPAGEPISAGRTCSASRRSSRARTSRRSSRRCGRCAASSRWRSRARQAGASAELLDDPAILKLGFVGRRGGAVVDARRGGLRLSVAASRASACRSSRRWPAASRSSPRRTRRWTRRAARPPSGSIQTTRRRSRPGSASALERRDELVAAGLEHAARFSWRACGEIHLRAFEEAA